MIISFYFSIMMIMLISLLAQFEFFVVVAKVSMNFSVNDYRLQEKKLFRGFAEYLCFRKFWRILKLLILEIYLNVGVASFKSNFNSSAFFFWIFFSFFSELYNNAKYINY